MIEGTNFVEFPVQGQLSLLVVTRSLELLLSLKEAAEQRENGVGAWVGCPVVGTEAASAGHVTRILVSGGKDEVAELVKVDLAVLRAIVLIHDIIDVLICRAQELSAHEIVEFACGESAISVTVQLLEQFHRAEVRVPGELLSS